MTELKYEIIKNIGVLSKSALALSRVEVSGWIWRVMDSCEHRFNSSALVEKQGDNHG